MLKCCGLPKHVIPVEKPKIIMCQIICYIFCQSYRAHSNIFQQTQIVNAGCIEFNDPVVKSHKKFPCTDI